MRLACGRVARIVALAFPALLLAGTTVAQNLVPNGTFDTDVQGWSATTLLGQVEWTASDALGASGSGAMLVASFVPNEYAGAYTQCLPVGSAPAYVFGALAYRPSAAGDGRIRAVVYDSLAQCQQFYDWAVITSVPIAASSWSLSKSAIGLRSHVRLFVEASANFGGVPLAVDNVFLCPHEAKGDLDEDFFPDLLLRQGATGLTYLWRMKEATRLQALELSPQPDHGLFAPVLVGSDDFDGDFRSDLVFQPAFSSALTFWFMHGEEQWDSATLTGPLPPLGWAVAATGDFNHDHSPDLLWRNSTTQQLQVTTLSGTTITGTLTPTPAQAVDANWSVVAALDYNADGNRDLLWYNATTGKIVFWFLDQNLVRITGQFANPPSAGDANWKVVAGGDYGIGASGMACKNDIVWRNDTSGRLVVWHMDSAGNRVAGAFITPDPSPNASDWSVLGPR